MWNRIAQILTLSLILCSTAHAQDTAMDSGGRFTILDLNQRATFRGTLFDPTATAYILTIQDRMSAQYQLDLDYSLGQLKAEHQLEMTNLNLRYEALGNEYQLRIDAKDLEIQQLNNSLSKLSRNDRHWFVIGGFAIGVGVTAGIVAAINSASN
jgi:hypothetical protein